MITIEYDYNNEFIPREHEPSCPIQRTTGETSIVDGDTNHLDRDGLRLQRLQAQETQKPPIPPRERMGG